jgi:hypothetical protein
VFELPPAARIFDVHHGWVTKKLHCLRT